MTHCIISYSEAETIEFAQRVAVYVLARAKPCIVCLSGDLGAGKSVFARAFIRFMAEDADLNVPSPTFTLVQGYDTPRGRVDHYDLYRLEDAQEIEELGWDDSVADGIVLVEWPQRLCAMKPAVTLDIDIKVGEDKGSRIITVSGEASDGFNA